MLPTYASHLPYSLPPKLSPAAPSYGLTVASRAPGLRAIVLTRLRGN